MSQYQLLVEAFDKYAGKYVEDRVTGFRGLVNQVSQRFNGNIVLGAYPRCVDKVADGADIDFQQSVIIECADNPHVDDLKVMPSPESLNINVGAQVQDVVSDAKMTIVGTTIFLNGCVYHSGTTKQREDGKVGTEFLPYQRFVLLDVEPVAVPKPTVVTPPGGPITKSQRAS